MRTAQTGPDLRLATVRNIASKAIFNVIRNSLFLSLLEDFRSLNGNFASIGGVNRLNSPPGSHITRQSSHLNFDVGLHSVRAGPVWLMFSVERFAIDKKYMMTPKGMEQGMMLENWN